MTRSNAREIAVHLIFAMDYSGQPPKELIGERFEKEYYACLAEETAVYAERPNQKQLDYIHNVVYGVTEKLGELDGCIETYSVGWNLSRISRLAKCIMRVAMYESLYVDDVPTGVAINEAINLAKKYEDENTIGFINGILGSFSRREQTPAPQNEEAEEAAAESAEQAEQ